MHVEPTAFVLLDQLISKHVIFNATHLGLISFLLVVPILCEVHGSGTLEDGRLNFTCTNGYREKKHAALAALLRQCFFL